MLAHSFDDYEHKIIFPCFAQPKLDGIRCTTQNRLFTRSNKEVVSVPYILDAIHAACSRAGIKSFPDGELYNHDLKNDFELITGAVRKDEPLTYEVAKVQYHIYDLIDLTPPFDCRHLDILNLEFAVKELGLSEFIKIVPTVMCHSLEDIEYWYNEWVEQGYEGLIIRNASGLYTPDHRSFDLLKYKKFMDSEFPIIGVEEGRGKLKGHAIFICVAPNGKTFKSKLKGSVERLKELFENPSLWKDNFATNTYQGLSKYGIPRFPVAKCIRNYE